MAAPLPPAIQAWIRQDGRPSIEFAQWAAGVPLTAGFVAPIPVRAGDIMYWNGSAWVTLPGNNSGTNILQETAAGVPSWVAPPVSTRVLLDTLTAANSATLDDTTSITGSFNDYEIVFENFLPASTATFELQVYSGGVLQTSGYAYSVLFTNLTSTGVANNASAANLVLTGFNATGGASGISGRLHIFNINSSAPKKHLTWHLAVDNSGAISMSNGSGWWAGSGTISGMRFLFNGQNITSGTVKIYGLS